MSLQGVREKMVDMAYVWRPRFYRDVPIAVEALSLLIPVQGSSTPCDTRSPHASVDREEFSPYFVVLDR
jgi:hypothetical protein